MRIDLSGGGAMGFVDVIKLFFALSSLAQPFNRRLLFTPLEIVFVTISPFTKQKKVGSGALSRPAFHRTFRFRVRAGIGLCYIWRHS